MTETIENRKVSLKDYAKAHPVRTKCRACISPLREELDAAFSSGVSIPIMVRWLREEHPDEEVSDSSLRHHFLRARHHVKK